MDRADAADLLTLARVFMSPFITWLLLARNSDAAIVLLKLA